MYEYVERFKKLGFGMFVHFGLYSMLEQGEWTKDIHKISDEKYMSLTKKFKIKKTWAKELVSTAKNAGCKYIVLTTRHHDGFSLYDTKGMNDYDAPHSATGRDLVKEYVDECNKQGLIPFFYHTLVDWYNKDYYNDFPKYLEYLRKSVEILCANYGKIGGLWFDGMWDKKTADWQEDLLYATIRKYQPEAMIINNSGLSAQGKLGHKEIDSVTFERGHVALVGSSDRPVAGEMCEVLNDHWGYTKMDVNYKSVPELIKILIDCRSCGCNFLLNVGPMGNGSIKLLDKCMLSEIGKWIKFNKNFIYNVKHSDITAENAIVLDGDDGYCYAVSKVPMQGNVDVALFGGSIDEVTFNAKIKSGKWLDDNSKVEISKGCKYTAKPFNYGKSMVYRVAKLKLKDK